MSTPPTPRGKVRVQIPGYAWLDALSSPFIADHESWWERHEYPHEHVAYVAYLDREQARQVQQALEEAKVKAPYQRRWALDRACMRIEADLKVMGKKVEIRW
jgi:hypothetical protein